MKLVTSAQMQKIERLAIEELEIPSILLMENAAIGLVKHCFKALGELKKPKVSVVCGPGNNGGDGMALARLLHVKGIETNIILAADVNEKGDAAVNYGIIKKLKIPVVSHEHIQSALAASDLTVDAVFGTGLSRNAQGFFKDLIEMINRYAKYVISVDIPSGVNSDTGRIMGCAVKAAQTVTFGFAKTGLYLYPGAEYAGEIHIEDISIPSQLLDRVKTNAQFLTDSEAKELLPPRKQRSNKGSFGKAAIFAGSNEMPGAAALACSAAYVTGAGLVCAYAVSHAASVVHKWQREVITRIVPDKDGMFCRDGIAQLAEEINSSGVIVIGPGIGRCPDVTEFVFELVKIAKAPLVLDADALYAVSENVNILKTLKVPCVITPHPGEMSRLTGLSVSDILDNAADTALNFSKEFNVITLLKDAHTIIANPQGSYNINTTGSNALSKAGTGDVLTGMIAGFIAQGADVFTASILGAYYHGKSGEAAALSKSNYSVSASCLLDHIPALLRLS
ncbi:MAG: NAD(P)H-hydrate dehydratase [Treponema sp.]|nr:NAD(P)H-hydrate dehydratase [Treponema sp.]